MSALSEDRAVIRPTLHHVNLKTTRLQEMINWYSSVVGMHLMFQFPGGAWLTNDTANHRLALLTTPHMSDDPEKIAHIGLHHFAFEYASLDDLLATYRRLKALGIAPHACLDHGMTTSLYYIDPDGNGVELQVDNFGSWEASSTWMRTSPEFAADPIGMPFDPEQLVRERAAGVSFEELHRRAYAGEFRPATPLDLRLPTGEPSTSE
jgi:catechol 2,3-dioxygenase